jgi:CheY-like chemotaxis protein
MEISGLDPQDVGARPHGALRPVSVLVIDDDIDTHEMLSVLLAHAGYSVATACNGREALRLLSAIRPEVILLDVEMPVMTGAQFREAQRRDKDLIRIPTIVMTGSKEEPQLDPGVAEVLHKPFRSKQLVAAIGRYCEPQRS